MTNDELIDLWNDGAIDGYRNRLRASSHPEYLEGYAHGLDECRVRVIMPARPEGYYHSALD